MCKDNLGNCGCGCNSCGGKNTKAKATTTTKAIAPLVRQPEPSGYSKKSSNFVETKSGSGYSKKSDYFTPSSASESMLVDDQVHEPEVEVIEPKHVQPKGEDNHGEFIAAAAGIGLASLFLAAVFRKKKKKEIEA